jgi:hypothetical protein
VAEPYAPADFSGRFLPFRRPTSMSLLGLPSSPPVVVFCKSHSGSRLLAEAIESLGVFMGASLNESRDSLPLVPFVERVILDHHPDFDRLRGRPAGWDGPTCGDDALDAVLVEALRGHFGSRPLDTAPWGWKLCESVWAVPVLERVFPGCRYIHLVRDGRDVAFCDHVAPDTPLWKKVFFGTDRIAAFRGGRMGVRHYRRRSHVFNAQHWLSSVSLGRSYAAMLGARCLEVRYEKLCLDFPAEICRVADFLGLAPDRDAIDPLAARVSTAAIGKHQGRPRRALREVLEIIAPQLLALGYLEEDPFRRPTHSVRGRLRAWIAGRAA